ncbi:arginine N-methyltransferase 2 [Aspergillus nomiae NRRL 13137]|uniref:Arginine N-methyltransferase 2 n=1 Tax=Aspergillus nomiae NRRL (strain ATCC 15546 / NRRL 13137 / CBS 260.88 / M93) TaxID=1509407 RepID=A0A0L1JCK7_ASPN3|nr:arginine N-methyltransferase 2 [Aspergillus nomiae NRRL 13137]KNG89494.1 arginine N-methyltransferase 2 [Aspergillus nomiae NRRL 13137]
MTDPTTEINVDLDVQEILLAASQHDIPKLRQLIRSNQTIANPVNVRDPETGYAPLHAAISACEPDVDEPNGVQTNGEQTDDQKSVVEKGSATVRRLGLGELYEQMVDAGVRAELLLNRLDGYEELEDDDEEEEEEGETAEAGAAEVEVESESVPQLVEAATTSTETGPDVTNSRYLDSNLTFQNDRLLDQDQNGVMMAWESDIMAKSAKKLLPTSGLRVLNVGHGMGIVDGFIQEQSPAEHHIIEAHPEVVAEMKRKGWGEKPGVTIHEGRWQDILPDLVGQGVMFDAIYYDTFAESYGDFREFFSEQVIGLLEQEGKWSFFNGMGADRQISYDVYQKVVEMDLMDAGFDVEWEEIALPKLDNEWDGVRRAYWQIESYRLPLCKYMD